MNDKNITYEVCPHCTHEVELPNTLGVHKCPHCGKYIVACSMCLALSDNKADCRNCPLCYLADKMNNEQFGGDLEKATNDLYNLIGNDFAPLDEIEYAGANGIGRALSIRFLDNYTHSVEIGYDVNGFLFTETRNMSELIYTDFLDEVMNDIENKDGNYAYLYERAYEPTSLAEGKMPRTIYCDEENNIPFKDFGTLLEISFVKNAEMDTDINVKYKSEPYGTIMSMATRFETLSVETINKLKGIVNSGETNYDLYGSVTLQINNVVGKGRTKTEAMRYAKEQIEAELTLYGESLDTQVNDYNTDITLE